MYLPALLVALVAASTISAQASYRRDGQDGLDGPGGPGGPGGPDGRGNGTVLCDKDQCLRIQLFQRFVAFASNITLLNDITDNNATEIAAIQAKAVIANTTLATLTSNATLVAVCDVIFAYQASVEQCRQMQKLEYFEARAANLTLLQKDFHGNESLIAMFQAKVASELPDLQALQSNYSLSVFCSFENTKAQCHVIHTLQREISMAANLTANLTALQASHPSDAQDINRVQDRASKANQELQILLSNTTLVTACAAYDSVNPKPQSLGEDPTAVSQLADGKSNTQSQSGAVPGPAGFSGFAFASLVALAVALLAL